MIQTLLLIIVIALLVSRFLPVRGVKQMDAAHLKPKLHSRHQQLIDVRSPSNKSYKRLSKYPLTTVKESSA